MIPDRDAYDHYFAELRARGVLQRLDETRIPRHIAIIMDGNGRWALQRGLERAQGHIAGISALKETITACVRLGVEALTIYAFSTENWSRPKDEVDLLMQLFATTLISELPLLLKEDVRLQYLGDMSVLPRVTRETFEKGLAKTAHCQTMTLAIAVNYGGRQEIVHACNSLVRDVLAGTCQPDDIDETLLGSYMWTYPLPDPDLLLRTSGEMRLSNYLLWQCAYSEFSFLDVLWPDFNREYLVEAIIDYQSRHRRFGNVEQR